MVLSRCNIGIEKKTTSTIKTDKPSGHGSMQRGEGKVRPGIMVGDGCGLYIPLLLLLSLPASSSLLF